MKLASFEKVKPGKCNFCQHYLENHTTLTAVKYIGIFCNDNFSFALDDELEFHLFQFTRFILITQKGFININGQV